MSLSVDGANLSLAAMYGDDHAATIGATITVQLGTLVDGLFVELDDTTYPGYASVDVDNDATVFPAPSGGQLDTDAINVCTATSAWPDAPSHWRTLDGVTVLDVGALDNDSGAIPTAGGLVSTRLSIFYNAPGSD